MDGLTVVAHCDIRDDLLQHRLPLRKLLVLSLRRLELCAELLQGPGRRLDHDRGR